MSSIVCWPPNGTILCDHRCIAQFKCLISKRIDLGFLFKDLFAWLKRSRNRKDKCLYSVHFWDIWLTMHYKLYKYYHIVLLIMLFSSYNWLVIKNKKENKHKVFQIKDHEAIVAKLDKSPNCNLKYSNNSTLSEHLAFFNWFLNCVWFKKSQW